MKTVVIAATLLVLAAPPGEAAVDPRRVRDLADLSLEELSSLTITSVARRETPLGDAPASIYVITSEDIRRSGATTLPEVLRLAPNLQVARLNALDYGITARGFNNQIGNKLLVLIDGRNVYNPTYSGVFWEMQDTMLEDVERIEVISGPGATMWGTNAVNGVINVITRDAADTQGALVSAQAANDERGAAVRYGALLGDAGAFRIYARTRDWDRTRPEVAGTAAMDAWQRHQAGFRADFARGEDAFTVQGDVIHGSSERRGSDGVMEIPSRSLHGHNLLARWTRGNLRVQAYWDHIDREDFLTFQPVIDTIDFELQHVFEFPRHRITWGGGHRRSSDEVEPGLLLNFVPESRTLTWQHAFAQGDVRLTDDLDASLGLRLERNTYTGIEYLPNLRLTWRAADGHFVWGGVSRAVRSPSRFDREIHIPSALLEGGPEFLSEIARVYELGYRGRPSETLHWNVAVFRHDWQRLRGGSGPPFPQTIINAFDGRVHGVEAWANWQATERWRLTAGMLLQDKELWARADAGPNPVGMDSSILHNDPDQQFTLRSRVDLGARMEFDLALRHVGRLPTQPVPAYTELDTRLGWKLSPDLDIALVGRNLLNSSHAEMGAPATRSEFRRSGYVWVTWRF